jgi:hypothetical protein
MEELPVQKQSAVIKNAVSVTQVLLCFASTYVNPFCKLRSLASSAREGRCQICAIPGYVFVSKPRQGGQGGGVGFYISSTISPLITAHVNTQVPEAIWLELSSRRKGAKPVFVGVVYLPPLYTSNYHCG